MGNSLKRFVERMNEEGRVKFNRLASDSERNGATASNVFMMAAFGASILTALYFLLGLILILIYLRDNLDQPQLWMGLVYFSVVLGCIQGSIAGGVLGWGQAEYWQGKRNKAGTIWAIGGATLLSGMALFQLRFYDPGFPTSTFLLWAIIIFSPGYFAATSLIAWGLNLLGTEKR